MFVLEKPKERGTCENRPLFQHTYTLELKQKTSVRASNYSLLLGVGSHREDSGVLAGSLRLITCYSEHGIW